MPPYRDLLRLSPIFTAAAMLACQGDTLPEPSIGTLEVSTATGGSELDTDGYTIRVDSESAEPIAAIGLVRAVVLEGQHNVTLEGLAANCAVEGENPRRVTVPPNDTTRVGFTVQCSPTGGAVEVSATTTGAFQPSTGYTITLDGGARRQLVSAEHETFYSVAPGRHEIGLSVTDNCQVRGTNPQVGEVTTGQTVSVSFDVACSTPAIAFTSYRTPNHAGIYVVNPDGSALTLLLEDAFSPVWSPDGQKIAFNSSAPGFLVVNADGSGARPLFIDHDPNNIGIGGTRWSPDGTTIAFQRTLQDPRDPNLNPELKEIWRVNRDGSGLRKLADGFGPAWSPDGRRIAFAGQTEIYSIAPDGGGLTQVTAVHREIASSPAWSPDGTRIAFAAGGDTFLYEIFTINADGTGLVNLPGEVGEETNPKWAPDGKRIAFLQRPPTDYGFSLAVMDPDGSARKVIFPTTGSVYDFVWSPHGDQIAFTDFGSAPDFNEDVYKINADGSGLLNLSRSPSYDAGPSWSSR
jgi:Tol biopolymer transport system component